MELTEETSKAVRDITFAMEKAKEDIRKKYNSILDDLNCFAIEGFMDTVENDLTYHFERWIDREVKTVVEALISGDMSYVKRLSIVSQYSFGKLEQMRTAIYAAVKDDIYKNMIEKHKKEVIELKQRIDTIQQQFSSYRYDHPER